MYKGIDLSKFILSIFVVGLHTSPFFNSNVSFWITLIELVSVPLFFGFSGYLFYNRKNSILKYIYRIGLLYITWFIIELPLIWDRFFNNDNSFLYDCALFVRGLLFNSTFYVSWYLMASIIGLLIVNTLKQNRLLLFAISFVSFLICAISKDYREVFSASFFDMIRRLDVFIPFENSFFVSIIYLSVGAFAATIRKSVTLYTKLCLIFVIGGYLIEGSFIRSNFDLFGTFFLMPLLVYFCIRILSSPCFLYIPNSLSAFFRHSSTLIYLVHYPIKLILVRSFNFNNEGLVIFGLVLALSIIFSILILHGANQFTLLRRLY